MLLFFSPAELHASQWGQTISLWQGVLILIFWSPAHGIRLGITESLLNVHVSAWFESLRMRIFHNLGNGFQNPSGAKGAAMRVYFRATVQSKKAGHTMCFFLFISSKNEEITAAKHENEDVFIDAQLQQTLADLDEDLEGREPCNLWGTKDICIAGRYSVKHLRHLHISHWDHWEQLTGLRQNVVHPKELLPFASGAATPYKTALSIYQAVYQVVIVFWCLLLGRDNQQFVDTYYGPKLV